jgi:hypothetical protein
MLRNHKSSLIKEAYLSTPNDINVNIAVRIATAFMALVYPDTIAGSGDTCN